MIYLFLAKGYEEIEAVAPMDILRRAKMEAQYVGVDSLVVEGAHGINIQADITVDQMDLENMEMVIIPGGLDGVNNVEASPAAMAAIKYAVDNGKYVAAICAAPTILGKRGWLDGVKATCYPGMEGDMGGAVMQKDAKFVVDGKFITGQAPAAAVDFGLAIVETLIDSSMKKTIMHFMVY